mgnify:CR=1 FL=1
MRKTILVTGCAGFIGSHVTQALLARGDTVVGLDNFNDYYVPERKRSNVEEVRHAVDTARLHLVEGDVRRRDLLHGLFARHQFDAVVHLAGMAGVRASMQQPHLYFDVNLVGTLNLLDEARDAGVPNFVFASTSSVYGPTRRIPFEETDPCDRPLVPYPASKRAAEMLGFTYHHLYGQSFTALRFFTVYGPRGRPDMMPHKLLDSIFFGVPVPVFNNGQVHRDWTYVDDIVAGVVAAADRPLGYEVINLGRGRPVLLSDFVGLVEERTGRRALVTPAALPSSDVPYTYADIGKARRLLGYDPQTLVEDGVSRFWEWYQGAVLRARQPARAGSAQPQPASQDEKDIERFPSPLPVGEG